MRAPRCMDRCKDPAACEPAVCMGPLSIGPLSLGPPLLGPSVAQSPVTRTLRRALCQRAASRIPRAGGILGHVSG